MARWVEFLPTNPDERRVSSNPTTNTLRSVCYMVERLTTTLDVKVETL